MIDFAGSLTQLTYHTTGYIDACFRVEAYDPDTHTRLLNTPNAIVQLSAADMRRIRHAIRFRGKRMLRVTVEGDQ